MVHKNIQKMIPIVITLWAIFVMIMYCRSFVIPRFIEFITK